MPWAGKPLALMPADDASSQPAIALNTESQHALETYPDQAYDGPSYQVHSPITNIENVTVPTFIVGGTWDLFQRGEPLLYRALNLPASEKKLMIGPWYHVTEGAGLTADDGSNPVTDIGGNVIPSINNLELAWFDHWLKGVDNEVDVFPTVEAYRLGAEQWVPDTTYPGPDLHEPRVQGALHDQRAGRGGPLDELDRIGFDRRGHAVACRARWQRERCHGRLAGRVDAPGERHSLRGRRDRLLALLEWPVDRTVAPLHARLAATLPPNTRTELQIEVFPTSATFGAGHSLRLTITTSDVPHEGQTLTTTAGSAGVDTFYFAEGWPASVYLGTASPL